MLNCLAWTARLDEEIPAARALAEKSLVIYRELDDRPGIGESIGILAGLVSTILVAVTSMTVPVTW